MDIVAEIAKLKRQVNSLVRYAVVTEVNGITARCAIDGNAAHITAPLRWLTQRAGDSKDWWAPSIGEQVLVISPSGEMAAGVILPALYSTANEAPSTNKNERVISLPDGAHISYDWQSATLLVTLPEGGIANVSAPGGFELTGDINHDGDFQTTGTINAAGEIHSDADVTAEVSLNNHKHGGVQSGGSQTEGPV